MIPQGQSRCLVMGRGHGLAVTLNPKLQPPEEQQESEGYRARGARLPAKGHGSARPPSPPCDVSFRCESLVSANASAERLILSRTPVSNPPAGLQTARIPAFFANAPASGRFGCSAPGGSGAHGFCSLLGSPCLVGRQGRHRTPRIGWGPDAKCTGRESGPENNPLG